MRTLSLALALTLTLRCTGGESSGPGAESCDVCASDYFLAALPTRCGGDRCCPCGDVRGVSCGFNTTEATLNLNDQEWRHSSRTLETYLCLVRDGWSPCVGGSDAFKTVTAGSSRARRLEPTPGQEGDGYCQPGMVEGG